MRFRLKSRSRLRSRFRENLLKSLSACDKASSCAKMLKYFDNYFGVNYAVSKTWQNRMENIIH